MQFKVEPDVLVGLVLRGKHLKPDGDIGLHLLVGTFAANGEPSCIVPAEVPRVQRGQAVAGGTILLSPAARIA